MPPLTYSVNVSGGGLTIDKRITRTGSHPNPYEETVPASSAKAVATWTNTDANTATAALATGHGLTDGTFDVFWTAAGVRKRRYGVTGAFTGDNLALDGGTGDDFPATSTTGVVVAKQTAINVNIDGDAAKLIAVCLEFSDSSSTAAGHISFKDAAGDEIAEHDLVANAPIVTDIDGGATNVYTGDPITQVLVSHNDVTNNGTLKIIGIEDATP